MKLAYKIVTAVSIVIISLCLFNDIHALEYQTSNNVEFTFNPSISVTISGDLSIPNLTPGEGKDSNIITVTAESNALSGYSLSSTVGNSTNTSNELRKDGTNTTYKFSNLTSNQSSLSNFNDNDWGYSYSVDNGTTWISNSITETTTLTGYGGYTYNTNTNTSSTITHINSTEPGTNSIQYKIGAKASDTQVAGEYTNVINFIGLANQNPTYITLDEATYMQDDFSCLATEYGTVKELIDNRDQQSYLVAKANDGNCWMIENLKLGKTITAENPTLILTPTDSNVDDEYTLRYSDIPADGIFHSYTVDDAPNQNNNNEWICRGGENDWDSCYYNWFTATAGAGTTYVTNGNVDTDICPAGWSLPTSSQFNALYSKYSSANQMLVDDPTNAKQNTGGKIPGFLLGGLYTTGGVSLLGSNGYYWSRTAGHTQSALNLSLSSSNVGPAYFSNKYNGFALRCLRSS